MEVLNNVALGIWALLLLFIAYKALRSVQVVPTQSAFIVERLGRYHRSLQPGIHFLIPFVDRVAYIQNLREVAIDVPPQDCFTSDNVKIMVDGVIYMSVTEAKNASYGITNYKYAATQLAQTTTRSIIGTLELDQCFEERELISGHVVSVLSQVGMSWGIKVHRYELKNIVPPETVRDAMERQMAAERERRALLARVEGEKQSRINNSEGSQQELVNRSEGERQRRINEAEGRAQEIIAVARATAESIEAVGATLVLEGGEDAIKLQLSQTLFDKLNALARSDASVILPADLMRFDRLLDNFGLDIDTSSDLALRDPRAAALAREHDRQPLAARDPESQRTSAGLPRLEMSSRPIASAHGGDDTHVVNRPALDRDAHADYDDELDAPTGAHDTLAGFEAVPAGKASATVPMPPLKRS